MLENFKQKIKHYKIDTDAQTPGFQYVRSALVHFEPPPVSPI